MSTFADMRSGVRAGAWNGRARALFASILFVFSLLSFSVVGSSQAQAETCNAGSLTFTNINQDRTLSGAACDTFMADNNSWGGFFDVDDGDAYSFYGLGVDEYGTLLAETFSTANANYSISSNLTTGMHTIRLISKITNVSSDTISLYMCPEVSAFTCLTTRTTTISVTLPVPPNITTTSVADATAGAAYSQTINYTDGVGAVSFDISAGALPAGLSISAGGVISGTPTAGGSFNFTVRARDTNSWTDTQPLTLTVGPSVIVITPATLPGGTAGAAYSQTIAATGGVGAHTFSPTGTLPPGLTLSAAGALEGTPTGVGSFDFTVTATDSAGGDGPYHADQAYTVVVGPPTLTVSPASLPAGTSGTAYSQALTAGGGTAAYAFSVPADDLPAGLTLSSEGLLSGTPTEGGSFTLSVTVTDATTGVGAPFSTTNDHTLTIGAPTIVVSPGTLTDGAPSTAYSTTFTASGGVGPHSFSLDSGGGALPAGLSLSSTGDLTGTPTAAGAFNFTVVATDSSTGTGGFTGSQAVTLTVTAPTITVSPSGLTGITRGDSVNTTISAVGGTAPYTYVATGSLPSGVTLSSSGLLSGTAGASGTFNFLVTATDSTTGTGSPFTGSQSFSWVVAPPSISLGGLGGLGGGTAASSYSETITASGGSNPYTFAIVSGALPPGLTLAGSTGVVSGTPTQPGVFTVEIKATDATTGGGGPYEGTRTYVISIAAPNLIMSGGTLADGVLGVSATRQTGPASGGFAPYTYSLTGGGLPPGMTLNPATGVVSGAPTTAGTFIFIVTATDSSGAGGPYTVSATYTMSVAATPVPTLSEWAMLLMALLLGGGAVATLRRRSSRGVV